MSSINQEITNVPKLEIQNSGVALPEESDILKGVINDFENAFGITLKFENSQGDFLLSTPQGQLASSIAAMISDRNRLLAFYVNQVDPNYAVGRMQDGIGRIYFIERKRATNTTVIARCCGTDGTIIPVGTKVKDQQGNIYESVVDGIIKNQQVTDKNNKEQFYEDGSPNIKGYVDIIFECLEKGIVTCPAETLTERYQVIQGWEGVTNLNEAKVGIEDETQAQFEQRRRQSVAHNSINSVDSIMAALLRLDIVEDAYVTENYRSYDKVITDNLTLKRYSIYVCVSTIGEKEEEEKAQNIDPDKQSPHVETIAKTIWSKKSPGCGMNGNISVFVKDDTKDINGNTLYDPATAPQYLINFDFAKRVNIFIYVKMYQPGPIVGDHAQIVKDKIYNIFTGKGGGKKPRIGSQVLASQFYCAVQSVGDWARILSLKIGFDPNPTEDIIQVAINQIPVIDKKNIIVEFEGEVEEAKYGR